jgi:ankyrin repeat protein
MSKIIEAVSDGNTADVIVLIKEGSAINVIDQFGYSLLQTSLSKGFDEISELLLENEINVTHQDKKGQTALHYCAFYDKLEFAKRIIELDKKSIAIEDFYGNEPLWTAVFNDFGRDERKGIIQLLVTSGSDMNHKNKANRSPMDIVITRPYSNLFDLFGVDGSVSSNVSA